MWYVYLWYILYVYDKYTHSIWPSTMLSQRAIIIQRDSFIQHLFLMCLLHARHCSKC